jgi:hypothetical protein
MPAISALCPAVNNAAGAGKVTAADFLGTRDHLKKNYMYHMLAAVLLIYGNSKQEAMYPVYAIDARGLRLDAAENRYTLRDRGGRE